LAAEEAAQVLIGNPVFKASQHIACYLPCHDEFDCLPIIEVIWTQNKACYLPVLSSETENVLEFAAYRQDDAMQANRYGILEPKNTPSILTTELDLVLMPLVAFDLKGTRLGMGGGYYDRTFAFLLNQGESKPYLMGVAYDMQRVALLPHDRWDVPLQGAVTEKGFFEIKPRI
jgi:5-formyltetrahydrofolate cyclo-ligase